MGNFDINQMMQGLAVGAIPVLFAITLHEVAHGMAARHFGDRTAEMMGRLSLNPLKHIDPMGTIVVPAILFMMGNSSETHSCCLFFLSRRTVSTPPLPIML